jgi:1A family penicillin-binding protein
MKRLNKLLEKIVFLMAAIIFLYSSLYMIARLTSKLPIEQNNKYYLYDKDNVLYSGSNKDWISLKEISKYLIDATITVEDKNFYKHQGFDYPRLFKALYINIMNQKYLQGASTITQQYAKNLYLDFDKTIKRKIDEAWLTVRLETQYSKDKILEGYLNTINYGGIFGIENASWYYFGKSSSELNLAEATILSGVPKDPSYYSPIANFDNAKRRQKLILDVMVKNKVITESDAKEAYDTVLTFIGTPKQNKLQTLMYYQSAVIDELKTINTIPDSFLKTGGLKIYTNLDMNAQTVMEEKIKQNLDENSELEIASVIMDPNTGKILAIAGGRDYSKSQYNRVTMAKRQVGSTMKGFLYYAALENGFTASTTFTSEKTTFTFDEDKTYSPNNYGEKYPNKPISMATAITYSDNIYAVKTHLFLGEDILVDTAKRIGITTPLKAVPSLALGSGEINILEMMRGYATFANEGYKIDPYFITKVEDMYGNVLYTREPSKENVLNKSVVFILNDLLSNCYAQEFIDYNYPTCMSIAAKMTRKYAVKTGTTDTDHLIFGYNKNLIMGVWLGYDDNHPTEVKDGLYIKNIWADTMETLLKGTTDGWYDIPKNVSGVLIEPVSGNLATDKSKKRKIAYYIKGTEPNYDGSDLDDMIPTYKEE